MTRVLVPLLLIGALGLSGCVAGIAASAVEMGVQAAQGKPKSNANLRPNAVQACSDQASRYGAVHVIDVEQRSTARMIVWGTVDDGKQRRSFECGFGTKVTYFKLRAIKAR